jgi:hypothetical protein
MVIVRDEEVMCPMRARSSGQQQSTRASVGTPMRTGFLDRADHITSQDRSEGVSQADSEGSIPFTRSTTQAQPATKIAD